MGATLTTRRSAIGAIVIDARQPLEQVADAIIKGALLS
jgi:hypothetical protein